MSSLLPTNNMLGSGKQQLTSNTQPVNHSTFANFSSEDMSPLFTLRCKNYGSGGGAVKF